MSQIFLKIVNMSISASYLVLAVVVLRFVLKKGPKWISVLLWGLVAVRLICPVSLESVFSLIPSAEVISPQIMLDPTPQIHTGIDALNSSINPVISETFAPQGLVSMNPLQFWIPLAAVVWLTGVAAMLIYTAVSYFLLRRKIGAAVRLEKNILQSENVDTPFVLGIFKPKIYLPFQMEECDLAYVIAHEQAHIHRKDHIWKPFGFLLLALHWFNPLMWVGYILLCRDIELACDEKVIKEMDSDAKADYTQALVTCSVNRRSIAACPLAFGEVGVKARVKSVLHYKKPAFWIVLVAVVICVAVAVCFLTNPMDRISLRELNYDEVNMPGVLSDVTDMDVTYEGFRISCTEKVDFNRFLATLDKINVSKEPISRNRSEDRSKDFSIKVNGNTELHFNASFTEIWVDNHVKPSLTHRITNPETAKELISDFRFAKASVTTKKHLTLDDVIALSKKGYDLTWSDFDSFEYIETGSGLYIRVYEINELFSVWIGGTWDPSEDDKPMYFYLTLADDLEQKIDIRDGGVKEFVDKQTQKAQLETETNALQEAISAAILEKNGGIRFPSVPTGAIHTHSYRILAMESKSGTPLVHQDNHMTETTVYIHYLYTRYAYTYQLLEEGSISTPAAITFSIDPETGYTVEEFWEPNPGNTYEKELREKFPEEAAERFIEMQNEYMFTAILERECYIQAEEYLADLGADLDVINPFFDSPGYDIDGDGKEEIITLTFGTTYGRSTFVLYATSIENPASVPKYMSFYEMDYYDYSFVVEDGKLLLRGEKSVSTKNTVCYHVILEDERIVLQPEDE